MFMSAVVGYGYFLEPTNIISIVIKILQINRSTSLLETDVLVTRLINAYLTPFKLLLSTIILITFVIHVGNQ